LAIANPSWNLTVGETFPIDLTFDGQAQFHFFASANSRIQISGILPNPAVEALRKSHLMIAAGKLETVPFDLKDASKLLPAIALCVEHIKASGLGAAADFVLLAKRTTAPNVSEKSANTEEKRPVPKLVDKTGSGFVVSETGHIVTNHHVIDKCVGDIRGNLTGESASSLRIVSTDEINDLALLQGSNRYGHRDATMVLLAFRHGLRAAELVDLRWDQVDLDNATLHVRRLKNGTPASHPLTGQELRALRRLQRETKSPFVFISERGAPLTKRGFQALIERAGEAAGFDMKLHPHMLRHACGFKLANEGIDTRTIQAYLGHRSIQHTVRYTELAPTRFRGLFRD
jgi:type 1 fimbriae regulatory protein FimB/type 1 fimbriae regulatory protein FimE